MLQHDKILDWVKNYFSSKIVRTKVQKIKYKKYTYWYSSFVIPGTNLKVKREEM